MSIQKSYTQNATQTTHAGSRPSGTKENLQAAATGAQLLAASNWRYKYKRLSSLRDDDQDCLYTR